MTKEDFIRKITSRKLWMAIAGLVTGILLYLGKPEAEVEQIGGLILAAGSVVAYIIGEGLIDAAGANTPVYQFDLPVSEAEEEPEKPEE